MNMPLECPLWWAIQYAATEPWRYPSRNTPAGDEIRATHHVLEGAWPVTTALYDLELVIPTLAEDIMIDKRIWPQSVVSRILNAQTPRSDEARQAERMVRDLVEPSLGLITSGPDSIGRQLQLAIHDILHPWRT